MAVQGCSKGGNMDCSDLGSGSAKASSCFYALEQVCEEQQLDDAILCTKTFPSLSASLDEIGELQ